MRALRENCCYPPRAASRRSPPGARRGGKEDNGGVPTSVAYKVVETGALIDS